MIKYYADVIYPGFYESFNCKAARCEHSCCKGWEIDIDDDTANYYLTIEGTLGERIRKSMGHNEQGYFFELNDDCCPHLDEHGLCEIMKELGEDGLCDICHLHPRFYFERQEILCCGLGASCEAVCELLLRDDYILFYEGTVSGKSYSIFDLISMLGYKNEEMSEVVFYKDKEYFKRLVSMYRETEPIDENWKKELDELSDILDSGDLDAVETVFKEGRSKIERIYSYILFRQLERMEADNSKYIVGFAVGACNFIALYATCYGGIDKALRRWSEQMEYSTLNIDLLISQVSLI